MKLFRKIKESYVKLVNLIGRGWMIAAGSFVFFVGLVIVWQVPGWHKTGAILMLIPFIQMAAIAAHFRPYPGERRG